MINNIDEYIKKYNLKNPILKIENFLKNPKMSSTIADPMQLRTRTSTRKISNENLQSEISVSKPKRRKSADSNNGHTGRATQRSKSNRNRSSSRGRTIKSNAPKLYTKKDLDSSPVKTRSRRKTAPKTSPKTPEPVFDPNSEVDIIEIETIPTSFDTCEYEIVEKPTEPSENKSSEHRFENDEIEDTKNREKNSPVVDIKNNKGCTYYNSGYLRFTSCTIIKIVLITFIFLVVLTILNNVYKLETLNKLSQNWPFLASFEKKIDDLIQSVSKFNFEFF